MSAIDRQTIVVSTFRPRYILQAVRPYTVIDEHECLLNEIVRIGAYEHGWSSRYVSVFTRFESTPIPIPVRITP